MRSAATVPRDSWTPVRFIDAAAVRMSARALITTSRETIGSLNTRKTTMAMSRKEMGTYLIACACSSLL
ncbi:Uncharacterised protein [uncultured archaeon]|nr:Uncharacterised protein [uncultured archaeon]